MSTSTARRVPLLDHPTIVRADQIRSQLMKFDIGFELSGSNLNRKSMQFKTSTTVYFEYIESPRGEIEGLRFYVTRNTALGSASDLLIRDISKMGPDNMAMAVWTMMKTKWTGQF